MKTVFQICFPQEPGLDFPIENSNGHTMSTRARQDFRRNGIPTRPLTRQEWDDQRKPGGHYLRVSSRKAVPDVDFEAEDGSIHKTAEACLAHELKSRFGVETLAEVEAQMKAISDKAKLTVGGVAEAEAALYDSNGNPPFSGVPEVNFDSVWKQGASENLIAPSPAEAARLLASALSRRGLKVAEAATATGLTPAQVRATAASLPDQFKSQGGRVFLVS
jgi:hypothetical protein